MDASKLAKYIREYLAAEVDVIEIKQLLATEAMPDGILARRGIVSASVLTSMQRGEDDERYTYILVGASGMDGKLTKDQKAWVHSFVRAKFNKPPTIEVCEIINQIGGFMGAQHGNNNRCMPSGILRRYPQETDHEYATRVHDPSTGKIEIEPPADLETMKCRPFMMAQYLLDAFIVRDEWAKIKWSDHANESVAKVMDLCQVLQDRLHWELDATGTPPPERLYVHAKWTQIADQIIFTFVVSGEKPRMMLDFESPLPVRSVRNAF